MGRQVKLWGRRDFLSRTTLWGVGAALLGGALMGLRTLWPRAGRASALRLEAGRPEDFRVGQVSSRLLREHWVFVVRDEEGFYALSARCTHLGCRLKHDSRSKRFHCNCHGSIFSPEGAVLRGPASRHLERVYITLTGGRLVVDPGVRYRRERGEWASPGAFVPFSDRSSG